MGIALVIISLQLNTMYMLPGVRQKYLRTKHGIKGEVMTKKILSPIGIALIFFVSVLPHPALARDEKAERIVINIPAMSLHFLENGRVSRTYPVAVGKDRSQTPLGEFAVTSKVINPTWFPPGKPPVPPGPANPLGTRWIGLRDGYGIHGNNNPASIGSLVSLGCIRMYNEDVEELFQKVKIGTPVSITYQTVVTLSSPYDGSRCVVVYPDVYKLGVNDKDHIRDYLAGEGMAIPDIKIEKPVSGNVKARVCLGTVPALWINDEFVTSDVIGIGDEFAASALALANWFNISAVDISGDRAMLPGGLTVSVIQQAGKYYITLAELEQALGVPVKLDGRANEISVKVNAVIVNGIYAGSAVRDRTGNLLLPVRKVAELLNYPVMWDADTKKTYINGAEIPVKVISGKSYSDLQTFKSLFDLDLSVDESKNRIELNKIEVFFDGVVFEHYIYRLSGPPLLALRPLAEALGETVHWNGRAAVIGEIEIAGEIINGSLYIEPEVAAEALGVYAGWNPRKGRLEIISGKRQW